jgi:hypothetical protein
MGPFFYRFGKTGLFICCIPDVTGLAAALFLSSAGIQKTDCNINQLL